MYFEEFNPGDRFDSRPRVVTATDIDNFAIYTGAVNPLFLSDRIAKARGLERRFAPGLLTLSLAVGLAYSLGLFDHVIALANLEANFLNRVRVDDELRVTVEVAEKRETKHKDRGIVVCKLGCQNQDGQPVLEITRLLCLIQRKSLV